jgi:hypothetical protein
MHPYERVVFSECVGMEARPGVVGRVRDHRGTYGVEFDVAIAAQEVRGAVDQTGFVASLPSVPVR